MNDFDRDLKRTDEWKEYLNHYYRMYCKGGEFVRLDGNDPITIQFQKMSIDAIGTSKKTKRLAYMEEKYDFHAPFNFCLEIVSNTVSDPQVPGWMITAKADTLIYSFIWLKDILDVYVVDFDHLRRWFWEEVESQNWRAYTVPNSFNHTTSMLVPIKQVAAAKIYIRRHLITSEGNVIPANPLSNPQEVLRLHGLPFTRLSKDENAA